MTQKQQFLLPCCFRSIAIVIEQCYYLVLLLMLILLLAFFLELFKS